MALRRSLRVYLWLLILAGGIPLAWTSFVSRNRVAPRGSSSAPLRDEMRLLFADLEKALQQAEASRRKSPGQAAADSLPTRAPDAPGSTR